MRTLLAALAAVAIAGCARSAQQRPTNPIATPTASPVPAVRATSMPRAVTKPSMAPRTPAPTVRPTAVPAVVPTQVVATPRPSAAASPTPSVSPTQSASPAPSQSEIAVPQLPPDASPQIMALHIDRTTVRAGDTVSGWIVTSSNVASVEARIGYYSIPVPKMSIGHFALSYVVPYLPFFLHHTYDMMVIARNAAGVEVVRTIPIRIR